MIIDAEIPQMMAEFVQPIEVSDETLKAFIARRNAEGGATA